MYLSQLMARLVGALESSVDDVDTVLSGISDVLLHEAAKAGQVSGHARNAHDGALSFNRYEINQIDSGQ